MKFTYYAITFAIFISMLIYAGTNAQAQSTNFRAQSTWAYTFGGTSYDSARTVALTSDGNYLVAGYTSSFGAGDFDFWIIKIDPSGNIIWQKTFGGRNPEYMYSIEQTKDGGYVATGGTLSFGSGEYDLWVLKLNSKGDIEWQKAYGTSATEYGWEIHQTDDGGYIVSGKYGNVMCLDCKVLILRLDPAGNLVWQKALGNAVWLDPASVQITSDAGYIVTGQVNSMGAGGFDFWVAKLDSKSEIVWQKTYGGPKDDYANAIRQTDDGGYIVVGKTDSSGAGDFDAAVLKLDQSGNIMWQKTYGGSKADRAWTVEKDTMRDNYGGYLIGAFTHSFGAGNADIWILKIDSSGNIIWQRTYGGSGTDELYSLKQTPDDGLIAVGRTSSFGAGSYNFWVMKLNSQGFMDQACDFIQDSHTTPADSHFIAADTNFTPASPGLTTTETKITGIISSTVANPISSALKKQ